MISHEVYNSLITCSYLLLKRGMFLLASEPEKIFLLGVFLNETHEIVTHILKKHSTFKQ